MKYLYCEVKANNIAPLEECLDAGIYGQIESIITSGKKGYELSSDNILELAFALWEVKIILSHEENLQKFILVVKGLAENLGMEVVKINIVDDDTNYLEENNQPEIIRVLNFLIYNDLEEYKQHRDERNPNYEANKLLFPIFIDHGMAFGTGKHETTVLCLEYIAHLRKNSYTPRDILDMGTGSGILAIAAAKQFGVEVLATDIDDVALQKAKELIEINGTSGRVTTCLSNGFENIPRAKKFSFIVANILLNPLIEMKQHFYDCLDMNGFIVVSGILDNQVQSLVEEYEKIKFKVISVKTLNNWAAVIFRKTDGLQ